MFQSAWRLLLLLLLTSTSACLPRIAQVEREQARLEHQLKVLEKKVESQSLLSESVATGLEKATGRFNRLFPPNGQWLSLQEGNTLKWYLDEESQNIYVRYLGAGARPGSIRVSVATQSGVSESVLAPGEGVECIADAGSHRIFTVFLHQVIYGVQDRNAALFSVVDGRVLKP